MSTEAPRAMPEMRAATLLRLRPVRGSGGFATVLVMLMTLIYFGSVVDPVSHLHGLPALVVNEIHESSSGSAGNARAS